MAKEFPKIYDPKIAESKWYDIWQNNKIYKADEKSAKPAFSILMPPPNVTGILHFGHVLNNTIQDLYIRWKRMQGHESCWFPGIDHAGIATQSRVEKELKNEGKTRYDLGREDFLKRVMEWKEKYGGIILKQLRLLGVSCDWDRTLFTMDEGASNAVREVFVRLFDDGLIYRGKRIINWSPLAQTAISDEEVEFREVQEHFYTLRYKYEDGSGYLCVSTVRPETLYGDIAVAVNPEDERYKHLIGKHVIVPVVNRKIVVVADEHADPTFGTGCVKITPAHDPNDFEVGLRHSLEMINTINPDGTMNELAGELAGMERFAARKKMLELLRDADAIEKIEDYTHNVGFSQRGGEAIEPYLSDQWFVSMKPLAEIALAPVADGRIKFHPEHWTKTYEHWMTNIRDWCISRQLWWGHRIPVYYAEDGRYTAAMTAGEACRKLGLAEGTKLRQDEDVLDTWFSSWLWPMTTMNWLEDGNESNPTMDKFLPTDLLVTAPDIIFFWVARMIMASMKFKNEIPFKNVYFNSTIRDGKGRKLSKSLGNSPDPINIIDKYGADAVRFTMLFLAPLGQDIRMDVDVEHQDIPSMEIGRNFANKIWNAGRFLMMKRDQALEESAGVPAAEFKPGFADKWILSRLHSTIKSITNGLDRYRVDEYAKTVYDFVWRDFCDWYVEIMKGQMNECASPAEKLALADFAVSLYGQILMILHPIMPFMTEEIWHITQEKGDNDSISTQPAPIADEAKIDAALEDKFEFLQLLIEEVRRLRSTLNLPPQQKAPVAISTNSDEMSEFLQGQAPLISVMARANELNIGFGLAKPASALASVVRDQQIYLVLDGNVDLSKERERLSKEIERLERNIGGTEKKLTNESFVAKAPADLVAYEREKLTSMKESLAKVRENLQAIS